MPRRNGLAQQRRPRRLSLSFSTPRLRLSPAQMSVLQAAVDAASPPNTPTESLLSHTQAHQDNQSQPQPPQSAAASPTFYSHLDAHPQSHSYSHSHLCAAAANHALAQDPNIRPFGNGHHFSYQPLEQLSPQYSLSSSSPSSSSSEAVGGNLSRNASSSAGNLSIVSLPNSRPRLRHIRLLDEDEASHWEGSDADVDSESNSDSDLDLDSNLKSDPNVISSAAPESKLGSVSGADGGADAETEEEPEAAAEIETEAGFEKAAQVRVIHAQVVNKVETCDFTIEDIDPMDSGCEDLEVLLPNEVESSRSRSRSEHRDLDKAMLHDLKNLNCSNEVSDGDDDVDGNDDDASLDFLHEEAFLKRQQELKRIRRVSMSSSFGKRSHSELSDSDDNDGALDVSEMGSSARRFRKRVHRGSLLFQDAPAPRIDELEEPNSDEDEYAKELSALKEGLSYWQMEMMETDSN